MGRIIAENKHTGKLYPVDSKAIYRVIYEVVDVLPTENIKTSVIFCVPIIGKENEYDMYLYIDGWVSVGSGSIDLSDYYTKEETAELLSDKMDLAPLNPTAEQIAALPAGQVYSDTSNHKGILKTNGQYPYQDGQEFYDSVYIDQHYKQSYDQTGTSVVPILVQIGTSKIGEIGSTLLTHNGTYILFSTGLNPNRILNLEWRKTATYNIPVLSELPTGGRITSIVDGVATIDFYTGDLVEVSGKIYECSVNFPDGMVMPFNYKYEWREVDYYTKTEIDAMIGDIETALSEV